MPAHACCQHAAVQGCSSWGSAAEPAQDEQCLGCGEGSALAALAPGSHREAEAPVSLCQWEHAGFGRLAQQGQRAAKACYGGGAS